MFHRIPKLFHTIATALAVVILSVVLTFFMHNQDTYLTGFWDDYSQSLVFARILQMQQDQSAPGGFLGSYTGEFGDTENRYMYRENTPVTPDQYLSYTHQTGLQGLGFGVLNKVFSVWQDSGEARERMLYATNSILFYAVSLCLCIGLWKLFGAPAAIGWQRCCCPPGCSGEKTASTGACGPGCCPLWQGWSSAPSPGKNTRPPPGLTPWCSPPSVCGACAGLSSSPLS